MSRANVSRPILVMAGGTGGHVYPALAVARALEANAKDIVWLGTHRGLESKVIPGAGIDIEDIEVVIAPVGRIVDLDSPVSGGEGGAGGGVGEVDPHREHAGSGNARG